MSIKTTNSKTTKHAKIRSPDYMDENIATNIIENLIKKLEIEMGTLTVSQARHAWNYLKNHMDLYEDENWEDNDI